MHRAQKSWARTSWEQRRTILLDFRHRMAAQAQQLAETIPSSLARNHADSLAAEILTLLDACKFLEQEAEEILQPVRPGKYRLPIWLRGIHSEVLRDPLGVVLLLSPSNYPLFLPGVQTLQALVAGNACIWKPAEGCAEVAHAMRQCLLDAGLPPELLWVTGTSVETAQELLHAEVDKVFLTGSTKTAQSVLQQLAPSLTPAVMELSGCDAVFVLHGADLKQVTAALAFGMRLNGSATCMAPRRVFVPRALAKDLELELTHVLPTVSAVRLQPSIESLLTMLVEEAQLRGARLVLDGREDNGFFRPTLLADVDSAMKVARSDTFAPVLSLMLYDSAEAAIAAHESCPFALTAAIFGPERQALAWSQHIQAGAIFINDLIAPTADPRVPFGGRRASGYGVTRGREGLLEMTAPKVVIAQRSRYRWHYEKTGPFHAEMFTGIIGGLHGDGWRNRARSWVQVVRAAVKIGGNSSADAKKSGKD